MLQFDSRWRFDSPGRIEPEVEAAFLDLINRICGQGSRKALLEHFKSHFAAVAGVPHYVSSDSSWAATDLERIMGEAVANAPLFIDAFYSACVPWRLCIFVNCHGYFLSCGSFEFSDPLRTHVLYDAA